jgi:phosphonatase-like hydrolase
MPVGDVDLVIFDMAGTTIRDGGQVAEAFRQTLHALGVEITDDDLRPWRGASKRRALQHFIETGLGAVTPERLDAAYADFRVRLKQLFEGEGVRPIDGVEDAFACLRRRGVRLALTTGFDRDVAGLLLGAVGWDERTIDAVVCGDEVPQGRPAPYLIFRAMERTGVVSVRRVVNVGDTTLDLESGWNAGVGVNVGVLSGAHTREQLRQAPHTHLLPSVADLPSLLTPQEKGPGPSASSG